MEPVNMASSPRSPPRTYYTKIHLQVFERFHAISKPTHAGKILYTQDPPTIGGKLS